MFVTARGFCKVVRPSAGELRTDRALRNSKRSCFGSGHRRKLENWPSNLEDDSHILLDMLHFQEAYRLQSRLHHRRLKGLGTESCHVADVGLSL